MKDGGVGKKPKKFKRPGSIEMKPTKRKKLTSKGEGTIGSARKQSVKTSNPLPQKVGGGAGGRRRKKLTKEQERGHSGQTSASG